MLRCIPELAGRLAQVGRLSKTSSLEQSQANLDQLCPQEKTILALLNRQYKEKFGFPFVICARLNRKEEIIEGLKTRSQHPIDTELQIGIEEVMKICELRLRDIVQSKL